jgi:hypothetical protein
MPMHTIKCEHIPQEALRLSCRSIADVAPLLEQEATVVDAIKASKEDSTQTRPVQTWL